MDSWLDVGETNSGRALQEGSPIVIPLPHFVSQSVLSNLSHSSSSACHGLWTCVPLAMVLCATGYASALLAEGLQLGFKRDNFAEEMFDAGQQVR